MNIQKVLRYLHWSKYSGLMKVAYGGVLGALSGFVPAIASEWTSYFIGGGGGPWGNWVPTIMFLIFGTIGVFLGLIGGALRLSDKRFIVAFAPCIGTQLGGVIFGIGSEWAETYKITLKYADFAYITVIAPILGFFIGARITWRAWKCGKRAIET